MSGDLSTIPPLSEGAHESPEDGMCVIEAVSYIAGEPWSDQPACVCPVIGAFLRAFNDALPDDERDTLLRPFIPLVIGTKGDAALERRRAMMAADWLVRVHTPAWLRLAKLHLQADALACLPEIADMGQCPSIMPALEAARSSADAAWAAARAAAGAAARDAARDAAGAAAGAAARDAAWAASTAASWAAASGAATDAAWAASTDASMDAARDAAWAALTPTLEALQTSAIDLVRRMVGAAA